MATAAAIEVIIRARDEASAQVTATMQKIAGEATKAADAVADIGRSKAGGLADLVGTFTRGGDAASSMGSTITTVATLLGTTLHPALVLAGGAMATYAATVEESTKQQVAWEHALRGVDAAPFIAQLREANKVIEEHAKNAEDWGGAAINLWKDLRLNPEIAQARAKRDKAAIEAGAREEVEAEQRARQAAIAAAVVQERQFEQERRAAMQRGDREAAEAAMREIDRVAAYRLRVQQDALAAEENTRAQRYRQDVGRQVPEAFYQEMDTRRATLEAQADLQRSQRRQAAAQEQERLDAQTTRSAEQAAKAQAQAHIDAAEEVTRAWQRATQTRDRLQGQLADAQRELAAAQGAQDRQRFGETVAGLPALQAEQQRVAGLPGADPIRMLELRNELESLREEAASIQQADRRRAADDRVQAAQQRVDTLTTDFAKATANADALTAKVKELGTALQNLEPGPGFAARLSQALADTLEFLSARSP
jgi:hypothetical protein